LVLDNSPEPLIRGVFRQMLRSWVSESHRRATL
jgi:hypothetical protein